MRDRTQTTIHVHQFGSGRAGQAIFEALNAELHRPKGALARAVFAVAFAAHYAWAHVRMVAHARGKE